MWKNLLKGDWLIITGVCAAVASGQALDENFDGATGDGGAEILTGSGFNDLLDWDTGLANEGAFAGTVGDGVVTSASAFGDPAGGVSGSGAGVLSVSGASFVDGGWFAGLFWPDLVLATTNPAALVVQADVMGSVVGGSYVLRLEGVRLLPFGLDESFADVVGGAGVTFFDSTSGPTGFTDNWDDGIFGEQAFAGVVGTGTVVGGVTAVGLTAGGVEGGAGQLIVDEIFVEAGSRWYAGLLWADQVLPTNDLSEVILTAEIKGEANGGTVGDYMLRLEDQDQDYLAFKMTSNGSFQIVGGALTGAVEEGFGDGLFDVNSGPFNVVVVFDNDNVDTWGQGGVLTVDNLFLSGGASREVVGSVSFSGSADGTGFATIGGTLNSGVSTFDNVDEEFDGVTESGGGTFFDSSSGVSGFTPNWDNGVEGETAFAGIFGLVTVAGGASASGTPTGGVAGGGAGVLEVDGINVIGSCGSSGWYAGLSWPNQTFPEGDLSGITLRADVKGEAAPGETLGFYVLKVEDADQDFRAFTLPANGNFQVIGGALSTSFQGAGQLPSSDGIFDPTNGPFTVVIAFEYPCEDWGSGGKLTVDNLFLSSAAFGTGVDNYTVVVAMSDDAANPTWGANATLTVDNLLVDSLGGGELQTPLADNRSDLNGSVQSCVTDGDCDGSSVCRDGACYVPTNRMLGIQPNPANIGNSYTYRISLQTATAGSVVLGFSGSEGAFSAIGPGPQDYLVARVVDFASASFRDWTGAADSDGEGYLYINDCEIAPGLDYIVQAIAEGDDPADELNYTAPLFLPTAKFGDATGGGAINSPPDGVSNLIDVFAATLAFQNSQGAPKHWFEVNPPSGTNFPAVNLADVFDFVRSFQSLSYDGLAPVDCP